MKLILGIDTSNYTTSVCLIDAQSANILVNLKRLLPVKEGERGLRQSEALFQHTLALPQLLAQAFEQVEGETVAVAVSDRPSAQEGSYMPCFLAGVSAASAVSAALSVPLFKTTHQTGHVLAALYSSGNRQLLQEKLVCFHVSGGTTDALLVTPHKDRFIDCKKVAGSSDLKAGQAVDRIGVAMGLHFPAGKEMDALALKSEKVYRKKAKITEGNCSLSGLENLALRMLEQGESKEDTARFCVDYIANTLFAMCECLSEKEGKLPFVFAGGVMSNTIIKERLTKEIGAVFCPAEFSSDNAYGVAVYGLEQWNRLKN